MAVIYSELADNNFTGLGVSFGAGMTNICLAYYAVPVMTFSIARGGDWIDEQAARATGKPVDKVTSIKEDGFELDFKTDVGGVEGALAIYYENLLDYVIEHIAREVDDEDVEEGLDVPVVTTGGTASPDGFEKLFEDHLEDASLPFSVSGVERADEPLYSVARGSLVAARSEEDREQPKKSEAVSSSNSNDDGKQSKNASKGRSGAPKRKGRSKGSEQSKKQSQKASSED
jgi:hypothetical protein